MEILVRPRIYESDSVPCRGTTHSYRFYEDIYNERRLEFAGHRFFDLVRTGQAEQYIDGFVPNKHELFPIPQIEIDLAEEIGHKTQDIDKFRMKLMKTTLLLPLTLDFL